MASIVLTLNRQRTLLASLSYFQLLTPVRWRLCLYPLGLMAATVHVVPLTFLHVCLIQRCVQCLGPRTSELWSPSGPGHSSPASSCSPLLVAQWLPYTPGELSGAKHSPDSSPVGWDVVYKSYGFRGPWGPRWASLHINVQDLRVIHLALWQFLQQLRCCHGVTEQASVSLRSIHRP